MQEAIAKTIANCGMGALAGLAWACSGYVANHTEQTFSFEKATSTVLKGIVVGVAATIMNVPIEAAATSPQVLMVLTELVGVVAMLGKFWEGVKAEVQKRKIKKAVRKAAPKEPEAK